MSEAEVSQAGSLAERNLEEDGFKNKISQSEEGKSEITIINSATAESEGALHQQNGYITRETTASGTGDGDFSPENSEATKTVIAVESKSNEVVDPEKDEYDTHSDSIETLGEDGPPEDEDGSLSGTHITHIRLTNEDQNCHKSESEVSDIDRSDAGNNTDEKGKSNELSLSQNDSEASGKDSIIVLSQTELNASGKSNNHNGASRPESLSLPKPKKIREKRRSGSDTMVIQQQTEQKVSPERERVQSESVIIRSPRRRALNEDEENLSKSLPHGSILRKGDLIEFVADDLQEKIRQSSPMSRPDSGSMGSRRSSMRSISSICSSTSASTSMATSSGISRSPSSLLQQSPDDIPPIDPNVIMDLENQARLAADNVDLMLGNLRSNLHKMSAITLGCLEASKCSVDITCDSVDASIKSMYALMAKCEELSKSMPPVYQLANQISEIKRLLDLFEAQLADKT